MRILRCRRPVSRGAPAADVIAHAISGRDFVRTERMISRVPNSRKNIRYPVFTRCFRSSAMNATGRRFNLDGQRATCTRILCTRETNGPAGSVFDFYSARTKSREIIRAFIRQHQFTKC